MTRQLVRRVTEERYGEADDDDEDGAGAADRGGGDAMACAREARPSSSPSALLPLRVPSPCASALDRPQPLHSLCGSLIYRDVENYAR